MARIDPLPASERDERAKQAIAGATIGGAVGGNAANIFTTLARHPGLMLKWLPFGGKLLNGRIPTRERELLILRTGWNCRAEYEWAQHVVIGKAAGLTGAEIERITEGPTAAGWSAFDALLLRAADELHTTYTLSDETWAALSSEWDTPQLIELPMLVGHYHLVGMTLNTLGVELDPGLSGFPTPSR